MHGAEKVARATFVRTSSRQGMKVSTFICYNNILHERANNQEAIIQPVRYFISSRTRELTLKCKF